MPARKPRRLDAADFVSLGLESLIDVRGRPASRYVSLALYFDKHGVRAAVESLLRAGEAAERYLAREDLGPLFGADDPKDIERVTRFRRAIEEALRVLR